LNFDEDKLGSLETGKLADCVVIDRDYLACPEEDIRRIRAWKTLVAGKVVHDAGGG
jgi:predicted amidohydrolase YtcJ